MGTLDPSESEPDPRSFRAVPYIVPLARCVTIFPPAQHPPPSSFPVLDRCGVYGLLPGLDDKFRLLEGQDFAGNSLVGWLDFPHGGQHGE